MNESVQWLIVIVIVLLFLSWIIRAAIDGAIRDNQRRQPRKRPPHVPTGPGHFKVCGVDRQTQIDVVWYCDADSEANASAKGQLQGMMVTSVERVFW